MRIKDESLSPKAVFDGFKKSFSKCFDYVVPDFACLARDVFDAQKSKLKGSTLEYLDSVVCFEGIPETPNVKTLNLNIANLQDLLGCSKKIHDNLDALICAHVSASYPELTFSNDQIIQKLAKREVLFSKGSHKRYEFNRKGVLDNAVYMFNVYWEFQDSTVHERIKVGVSGEVRSEVLSIPNCESAQSNEVAMLYRPSDSSHYYPAAHNFRDEISRLLNALKKQSVIKSLKDTELNSFKATELLSVKSFIRETSSTIQKEFEINIAGAYIVNFQQNSNLKTVKKGLSICIENMRSKSDEYGSDPRFNIFLEQLESLQHRLSAPDRNLIAEWILDLAEGKSFNELEFVAKLDAPLQTSIKNIVYPLCVLLLSTEPSRDYASLPSNLGLLCYMVDNRITWDKVLNEDTVPASFKGFVATARTAVASSMNDPSIRQIPGPFFKPIKDEHGKRLVLSDYLNSLGLVMNGGYIQSQTGGSISDTTIKKLTKFGIAFPIIENSTKVKCSEALNAYYHAHDTVVYNLMNWIESTEGFQSWVVDYTNRNNRQTFKFLEEIFNQMYRHQLDVLESLFIEMGIDVEASNLSKDNDVRKIAGKLIQDDVNQLLKELPALCAWYNEGHTRELMGQFLNDTIFNRLSIDIPTPTDRSISSCFQDSLDFVKSKLDAR